MIARNSKLKLLNSALLATLCVVLIAGACGIYVVLNLWTVVGYSTGITYKATSLSPTLRPLETAVEMVAKKYGLESSVNKTSGDSYAFYWRRSTGIFETNRNDLQVGFEAHPIDEPDARKRLVTLMIHSSDTAKSNEWQRVAKDVELAVSQLLLVASASVQADSAVYGLCASKDRPAVTDSICHFEISYPVDFKSLNETILEPRKTAHKSR